MAQYTETTEADVENYLVRQVSSKLKGRANKYNTPGRRAAPDRIILYPVGKTAFVECKRPKKEPTAKQWQELKRLWASGHDATWIDTKEKADAVIRALLKGVRLDSQFTELLHEIY